MACPAVTHVFSLSLLSIAQAVATVPTSTCNSLCLALLPKTSSRCFRLRSCYVVMNDGPKLPRVTIADTSVQSPGRSPGSKLSEHCLKERSQVTRREAWVFSRFTRRCEPGEHGKNQTVQSTPCLQPSLLLRTSEVYFRKLTDHQRPRSPLRSLGSHFWRRFSSNTS